MPAYNFQKQFAEPVRTLHKHNTIRAKRKNRPRVGQIAHCFTGMRTKKCECLGKWPIVRVSDILMGSNAIVLDGTVFESQIFLDIFAHEDGFRNWDDMRFWFTDTHGLPFRGDLIEWNPFTILDKKGNVVLTVPAIDICIVRLLAQRRGMPRTPAVLQRQFGWGYTRASNVMRVLCPDWEQWNLKGG